MMERVHYGSLFLLPTLSHLAHLPCVASDLTASSGAVRFYIGYTRFLSIVRVTDIKTPRIVTDTVTIFTAHKINVDKFISMRRKNFLNCKVFRFHAEKLSEIVILLSINNYYYQRFYNLLSTLFLDCQRSYLHYAPKASIWKSLCTLLQSDCS
jgi:hypothetical protein